MLKQTVDRQGLLPQVQDLELAGVVVEAQGRVRVGRPPLVLVEVVGQAQRGRVGRLLQNVEVQVKVARLAAPAL